MSYQAGGLSHKYPIPFLSQDFDIYTNDYDTKFIRQEFTDKECARSNPNRRLRANTFCFQHPYDYVNVRKEPTRGKLINLPHDIPFIQGPARKNIKEIHPKYCVDLFPRRYHKDGTIWHYGNDYEVSMEVIAFCNIRGYYFMGEIINEVQDESADVKFDYGHTQEYTMFRDIIRLWEKRKRIKIGDYVMANVINELNQICWVPGQVIDIDYSSNPKLYRVVYYNNEEDDNTFYQLVRISKRMYLYAKDRILRMAEKDKKHTVISKDLHEDVYVPPVDVEQNFIITEEILEKNFRPILQITNEQNNLINNTKLQDQLLKLRNSLPELRENAIVLAKWPSDGWYYESKVLKNLGNGKYKLESRFKDVKQVYREDIYYKQGNQILKIGDAVIALHPNFEFAYAPAEIVRDPNDGVRYIVRFYDFTESTVEKQNIYKLDLFRFQYDIDSIVNVEKSWIGETVLAFNNRTKLYEWGVIVNRIGKNRQFTIKWPNGEQYIQNAYNIFVSINRKFEPIKHPDTIHLEESETKESKDSNSSMNKTVKFKKDEQLESFINEKQYTYNEREANYNRLEDWFKYSSIDKDRATPIIDAKEFFTGKQRGYKFEQECYYNIK